MSPSEIAFLAIGLVIGAAVGAAIAEALRARPASGHQVRVTISPNSVHARRSSTLADPAAAAGRGPIPGSPEDGAWTDGAGEMPVVPAAPATTPSPATAPAAVPLRTRVPSSPVAMPATAVAVPVEGGGSAPVGPGRPAAPVPAGFPASASSPAVTRPAPPVVPPGGSVRAPHDESSATRPGPASSGSARPAAVGVPAPGRTAAAPLATALTTGAVSVLDPVAPLTEAERARDVAVAAVRAPAAPLPSTLDVGDPVPGLAVRTRPPTPEARPSIRAGAVPVTAMAAVARAGSEGDVPAGSEIGDPSAAVDPCEGTRRLVDERCAVATTAREHAKDAADALREARRAYDFLRDRLDAAQAIADPRELAAAKDELHRRFRTAGGAALNADEAEAAAREWLNAINDLNARAREAARFLESGGEELRGALPRLERLGMEADAARISAEGAEADCHEARERLAACEEDVARAARTAHPPEPDDPHPYDEHWPGEAESTRTQSMETSDAGKPPSDQPLILRMLRDDRAARDRLVASLAGGDQEAARAWQLSLAALMDAISARAIEDGYLDLPDDDPFWGLFEPRERREVVGALSALGYRFDGLRGFADGRVPAARDLSLAVGYAGLDRMRIRTWPREGDLASLFERATVAADEWLVDQADDLQLGRMVDALGARAADLADVWNAWGRLRPALLSST